ncbi:MAG: DegT/DnrJ/EryC1/StrS family aminotransferase [Methylophilaceae bacterium]|nr:DegT/DnrJ/EryC1/StrS family aminotransferase [Methylophilaceae bacterium]
MIPVYKPYLCGNERSYLIDAFDSSWISSRGAYLDRFESDLSKYIKIENVTSVANGTVALHLAILALGLGDGDEVILPDYSYVACANAISYCGARPVFVDASFDTWQMNIEDLSAKITEKTKAVLVVHMYGNSEDMEKISELKIKYGFNVIEDCAEAIGTKFSGKHVGSYSDISTFSFFGNKTITTGEGGAVCSNDKELIDKVRKLKNQGLSRYKTYYHDVIGYNYRMTNLSAAIGTAQLEKIDEILEMKKNIALFYKRNLNNLPIEFQEDTSESSNSNWMVSIKCKSREDRDGLRKHLDKFGIETRPGFETLSSLPMYKGYADNNVAKSLSHRVMNLPSFPSLTQSELILITDSIKSFYE